MTVPPRPHSSVSLVTGLLVLLTACSNSPTGRTLQDSLAADPRLTQSPSPAGQTTTFQPNSSTRLPDTFPAEIPVYPRATLQEVTPAAATSSNGETALRWTSPDPVTQIQTFYLRQFQEQNWQILRRPSTDQAGLLVAQRNGLQVTLTLQSESSSTQPTEAAPPPPPEATSGATAILLRYQRPAASAQTTPTSTPQPGDSSFIGPVLPNALAPTLPAAGTAAAQSFLDLDKAPSELRQPLQDLAALGVLTLDSGETKSDATRATLFEPNKTVTRREYARWLFAANNRLQTNRPAQQVRAGVESSQPAFQDIPRSDPDFAAIQGLAEAGILPSSLAGNSTLVTFRPDAPLTRETLLLWKVPLDTRQALGNASVDAVKQTWGFQDAGRIDPLALRAVLADFQTGDQANIRRVFGYTTLLQPKKAVTRAEAAATLWYFGGPTDGISAAEVLKVGR